jgi:predicted transcriptional regulator/DNA-binding XRE family transcriptional regulator
MKSTDPRAARLAALRQLAKVTPGVGQPVAPRVAPRVAPPVTPSPGQAARQAARDAPFVRQPWAHEPFMPPGAKSRVLSVRMRDDEILRLYKMAEARKRAPHAIMKEAILHWLDREEVRDWLRLSEGISDEALRQESQRAQDALAVLGPGKVRSLPGAVARRMFADNRIRAMREHLGWGVEELAAKARKLGVRASGTELTAIENGHERPSVHLVWILCRILGTTPDELMG